MSGGGKGGGGASAYHYILTLVMNLCRGPINELVEIHVGDEPAWNGSVDDDTPTIIDRPKLFGGDSREGGIQGAFRLLQGAPDQVLPDDANVFIGNASGGPLVSTVIRNLKTLIGIPMGEMRGYAAIVYDGLVCSLSPYPKEWKMRMRRFDRGWYGGACWYPAKARVLMVGDGGYDSGGDVIGTIRPHDAADLFGYMLMAFFGRIEAQGVRLNRAIHAMNPAHIIYQCLTDPLWGAGQPASRIDENSFIYAANKLCDEGFGLCFLWARQEDVDTFIQVVIDHIGGVLYNDRETGKYVLRLIRDDYDPDTIPLYTFGSGLLSIEAEDNAGPEETLNEVIVKGNDPVTNEPFEVRAQNIAALQANGGEIISHNKEYKGLPTRNLALRIAQRDLRASSTGLKRYTLRLDRRAYLIAPGMVVRIQAPEVGIADTILRLGEVDYGSLDNGEIRCKAIEDVFGMPDTTFIEPPTGNYQGQIVYALPSPRRQLIEANYRDILRRAGSTVAAGLSDTTAAIGQLALQPTSTAIEYDLISRAAGETNWRTTIHQTFNSFGMLDVDISASDTELQLKNIFGLDETFIGQALLIGGNNGEIVRLEDFDSVTSIATVSRGCVDTVPRPHAMDTEVWALDQRPGADGREYALGETVETQVLTRTRNAGLSADEDWTDTIELAGRQAMPYPPGNVQVDGVGVFELDGVYDEPVFTWVPRDRIAQADQIVAFDEGGVGPEPGTTWRIRIYDPADLSIPLRTADGLTVLTWTYDASMQAVDGLPAVTVRIDSQRDGIDSWQAVEFTVQVDGGYGLAYGWDYGGA